MGKTESKSKSLSFFDSLHPSLSVINSTSYSGKRSRISIHSFDFETSSTLLASESVQENSKDSTTDSTTRQVIAVGGGKGAQGIKSRHNL